MHLKKIIHQIIKDKLENEYNRTEVQDRTGVTQKKEEKIKFI